MKPFKEKSKQKKKRHFILEQVVDFIFEGILNLLWRLVVRFFHLIGRMIVSVFHHFF